MSNDENIDWKDQEYWDWLARQRAMQNFVFHWWEGRNDKTKVSRYSNLKFKAVRSEFAKAKDYWENFEQKQSAP